MKTTYMAKAADIERKWYVIDAEGKTLGRLAAEAAKILRGKNKPIFTPHVDTGDHVIIVNADKVVLTGKKLIQKTYFRHSGYPGGTTFTTAGKMLAEKPERVLELAIKGMLPKNTLGRQMYRKLKVYRGAEHPHAAQQPEKLEIDVR
ncbi:ribosomal protein l13 signature [Lucifera butyrica]|uniref:Large ribosomal subunit protein uL13 n=1 Tax=Lucifera butyrica TaxID=1351585 RepID=A0A498R275_9FIRM|nr:50S ribosomal protein L13 [Lucifera butyrica]VBB04870.1 ribosomal protein l13 signature [Lucifera butyrica]